MTEIVPNTALVVDDTPEWELVGEYVDHESGANPDRQAFRQMFADAHQRKFDLVIFWALDRFSREGALQTLTYLSQLEESGAHFKSYTEQYLDSSGTFKDAIISILATLAKQERIRMSERVKAGMERAKREGKNLGRPSISPETVARIPELRAEGLSPRSIAQELGIGHGTVRKYLKD